MRTEEQSEVGVGAYAGVNAEGIVQEVVADDPQHKDLTIKALTEFIRDGLRIERVTLGEARKLLYEPFVRESLRLDAETIAAKDRRIAELEAERCDAITWMMLKQRAEAAELALSDAKRDAEALARALGDVLAGRSVRNADELLARYTFPEAPK